MALYNKIQILQRNRFAVADGQWHTLYGRGGYSQTPCSEKSLGGPSLIAQVEWIVSATQQMSGYGIGVPAPEKMQNPHWAGGRPTRVHTQWLGYESPF